MRHAQKGTELKVRKMGPVVEHEPDKGGARKIARPKVAPTGGKAEHAKGTPIDLGKLISCVRGKIG
jgi:hypothetical protein